MRDRTVKTRPVKRQFFVPYSGKIADITHADTDKHTLDLATALSDTRKIIMVIITWIRISGTGELAVYPNEGTGTHYGASWTSSSIASFPLVIKDGTQRLQYALSVASDDFDMYCKGYVVEA